jgi:NADPH:quinone reductase-like Zn-dependent oxidoreductase
MRTMKAIQIASFGGAEVLQLKELAIPPARSGEILLKNDATGVNSG